MKLTFRRQDGVARGWPAYMFGGRVRTSTAALMLAFVALFWVNQNYQPEPAATVDPSQQVVPPGFVPDPNYTWVPRTNVRREPAYTTTPTTTTTTTNTTTTTTSPTEPPTSPDQTTTSGPDGTSSPAPTTTVIDPDGIGPSSPQTFTQSPPLTFTPNTTPAAPSPPTTVAPR